MPIHRVYSSAPSQPGGTTSGQRPAPSRFAKLAITPFGCTAICVMAVVTARSATAGEPHSTTASARGKASGAICARAGVAARRTNKPETRGRIMVHRVSKPPTAARPATGKTSPDRRRANRRCSARRRRSRRYTWRPGDRSRRTSDRF
jgi:hypothetical protein